jgi:epoxyqueuosine reductase QueG
MKTLNQEIKESLLRQGAALVGFADLSDLPSDIRDGYRYGISIAVELNPKIVKIIGNGPNMEYSDEYDRVNKLLNQLGESCAELLKTKGINALAKTQSVVIQDAKTQTSKLPHKTVATKAGLGWIGKCALLITEEYGPAIRITSVLTDADLDIGTPITVSKCGKCEKCKNICPAGAISGIEWKAGLYRDDFIKALDCDKMLKERGKVIGGRHGSCGLCIWVCPWTQKHLKKSLGPLF